MPAHARRSPARKRASVALVAALVAISLSAALPGATRIDPRRLPPNVIVILTDDQTMDTLPSHPPAMPWLQRQIFGSGDGHWLWYPTALFNTPLCCPSRATILTGQYSDHTGVTNNHSGNLLDESDTLATWLHAGGYRTALIGKYLNNYPWDRGPYVPAGWDRFVGKRNTAQGTTYDDYQLIDQGVPLFVGDTPGGYATDYLANLTLEFLRSAPTDQPYFLMFTPSAPHSPWHPAPRDDGAFAGLKIRPPSERVLNDVRGKPAWVRDLPRVTAEDSARFLRDRRKERETLLAVDEAVRRIVAEVRARGELDRTVILFLTDNGYAFGQHRIEGKRCPYEECIRTPFAVRTPYREEGTVGTMVSNADLAPTIADLAGVTPGLPEDGRSFAGEIRPGQGYPAVAPSRPVLIQWDGDREVPPWRGVRTRNFCYVEDQDGTVELYDLTGSIGRADPHEMRNVARDPRYAQVRRRMEAMLHRLLLAPGSGG